MFRIDTPGVIHRVSMLFHGNPALIQGFNTFLPPGYRIELSSNPSGITVTTPNGLMDPFHAPHRMPREPPHMPNPLPQFSQPPFGHAPPPILPVGLGPGSRPTTPLNHGLPPHAQPAFLDAPQSYSPAMQGAHSAAASLLGGLGSNGQVMKNPQGEFNHAIQFLNKIKMRYSDEPDIYKQFLEILQTYQKEQKQVHDVSTSYASTILPDLVLQSQVYAQVYRLFKDAPDLMDEFKDFLPEALGQSIPQQSGLVGIMPHPTGHPSAGGWDVQDTSFPGPDKAVKAPNRRRKRAADKEPAQQQKAATSRVSCFVFIIAQSLTSPQNVKRTKVNHNKPDPPSPKFSSYQRPQSPEPLHSSMRHMNEMAQQQQQMLPPQGIPQMIPELNGLSAISSPEALKFFDRTKRTLEHAGTYEDFLKLLHSFAREVIDSHALIQLAEPFLADGDLWQPFKELLGWDEKKGNVEHGPPGSIRTSAPDPQAAIYPDDDEGPSYRRLPSHVSQSSGCIISVLNLIIIRHRRKLVLHVLGATSLLGRF